MDKTARIIEVFPSIQGEGIFVGLPHLFVRFWNCNLACHYCDTDYRGPYREVTDRELLQEVRSQVESEGPFHAVSLTGGEPLLWASFLEGWLPGVKEMGQRVYLETNGTLEGPLRRLLPWTDIVAMDLKPPSATADRAVWREHEGFLRAAHGAGKEVFIKIVVTRQTEEAELERAFRLVAELDRRIPVVLQPVTPWGPVRERPMEEQLARWSRRASACLSDVRVIPQVHRILGVP